jgi:hypothetical protein
VRKFRIDETVAPLLGILFVCTPLIIIESPSGYNDIIFVWYLVTLIFFVTEKMKPATLFLFILCCIGVMNLKYSGFFLGGLLCAIFFFGNLRRLRLSFLLFLPLFLLGLNGYIHNYVTT